SGVFHVEIVDQHQRVETLLAHRGDQLLEPILVHLAKIYVGAEVFADLSGGHRSLLPSAPMLGVPNIVLVLSCGAYAKATRGAAVNTKFLRLTVRRGYVPAGLDPAADSPRLSLLPA